MHFVHIDRERELRRARRSPARRAARTRPRHRRQPDLVAWYDARRGLAGLPPIDDELVRWVLGRCSLGEGYLAPGRLVYQQRGCIEPDTVALMLAKLPTLAKQLEQAARA
jgi:hypothetical protein